MAIIFFNIVMFMQPIYVFLKYLCLLFVYKNLINLSCHQDNLRMDKNNNNILENIFQLSIEPLYVGNEVAETFINEDNKKQNTLKKKKKILPTVFSALVSACKEAVIKINSGLYVQTNHIKIAGIHLQANEPSSNVVLANEQFPLIIIDLPDQNDKVYFENIKFAHLCEHSKGIIRWSNLRELKQNQFMGLKIDDCLNTCIIVRKGILQVDECRFSLSGQKNALRLYPCIVVQKQGSLVMTRCEVLGGKSSIGIYCKGGKINIRQSSFKNHGGIGILMVGAKQSNLIVKNSIISGCSEGIVLNGPFCGSVENNTIQNCPSSGLVTLFGNSSNILNNQIRSCSIGIQIQNSCPKIMKNNLLQNKQYGITIFSLMNRDCWAIVRFNLISENMNGGLLASGSRNRAQIRNNIISLNKKVGIRIEFNSHPHIFLNQILNTFGNGVHICEGATSFLQKNQIVGSLNCGIVLQGPNNIDNYIYNNDIRGSRGQGMLLTYCQKFLIAKNRLFENYNGIMSVTSVVNVEENEIKINKCNGIVLLEDSQIIMSGNVFEGNKCAGFVCRSTSKAKMKLNRFMGNKVEVVVERKWDGIEEIENENEFIDGADIRVPGNISCQIM